MSVFLWAYFHSTKSCIKVHTQIDIDTEIPLFYCITNTNVHNTKFMDNTGSSPIVYTYSNVNISITPSFSLYIIVEISSSSASKSIHNTRLSTAMSLTMEETTSFLTPKSVSPIKEIEGIIRPAQTNYLLCPQPSVFFHLLHQQIPPRRKEHCLDLHYRWNVELFFKWIKWHLQVKSFGVDS